MRMSIYTFSKYGKLSLPGSAMLIVLGLILAQPVFCQVNGYVVKGKVVDAVTNQSLLFASVVVAGSNRGTVTNENGDFEITISDEKTTLLISCAGYKAETLNVTKSDSLLAVKLVPVDYLLQEVVVYAGTKKTNGISSAKIENEQVKDLAGMTKDPLRSVQLLPGVSVDNEASNKMNVRGGTSDENLILVNGVEVYDPDHLRELSGVSISIFNIDLVKSIDFSSGGFSVKYGNALSSVMKIDYREGNRNEYKGKVDLSLLDLSGLLEGPIDHNGSFIIGVRKSYLDYLLRITNTPSAVYMGYYDIQGQIDYDLGPLNKLRLDVIVSRDEFSTAPYASYHHYGVYSNIYGKQTLVTQSTTNHTASDALYSNLLLSIKSDNVITGKLAGQSVLYYYGETQNESSTRSENSDFEYSGYDQLWSNNSYQRNLIDNLVVRTLAFNQNISYQASPVLNLDAGVNYKRIQYDDEPNMRQSEVWKSNVDHYPDTAVFVYPPDPTYNDMTVTEASTFSLAGYLQQTLQVGSDLIFNAGIRADYFDMNRETRLAPRASLSYGGPFGITFRAACGVFYEPPSYKQLRSSVASDTNTAFERATHYILGLEKAIGSNMTIRCEFYRKDYSDMVPTFRLSDGDLAYGNRQNNAKGFASGMDLMYNASLGSTHIVVSYSYLVAREKLINSAEGYYPRYTDQTHTLSLAAIFHVSNLWTLEARAFYGSGFAYTPYFGQPDSSAARYVWVEGRKNSAHYPPYQRVDLRVAKVFPLFGNPIEVYLDVMNVLNRKNVFSYSYSYDQNGNLDREANVLFGLIPTLGVNYSF